MEPDERARFEDDYAQATGILPDAIAKTLRGGLLSADPAEQAAAATRIDRLNDADPDVIAIIPEDEHRRARAIAGFADLGLPPARAVELAEEKLSQGVLPTKNLTGGAGSRTLIGDVRVGGEEGIPATGPGGAPDTGTRAGGSGTTTPPGLASQSVPGGPAPKTYPTDDGRNPIFKRFRKNLAHFEKGFVNRKTDPGGPTNKGISQKFLDRLNRRHPEWKLPKNTGNLKKDHIDGIFGDVHFKKADSLCRDTAEI